MDRDPVSIPQTPIGRPWAAPRRGGGGGRGGGRGLVLRSFSVGGAGGLLRLGRRVAAGSEAPDPTPTHPTGGNHAKRWDILFRILILILIHRVLPFVVFICCLWILL